MENGPFKIERMTPQEITAVVRRNMICRIAFKDDEHPHVSPFQYAFVNGNVYFHFSDYGKKIRLLDENPDVCVELEENTQDMSKFCFVTIKGTLERVNSETERRAALSQLVSEGGKKFSEKFLAAHGFKQDSTWKGFLPGKAFVIVKLTKIVDISGLKSPGFG